MMIYDGGALQLPCLASAIVTCTHARIGSKNSRGLGATRRACVREHPAATSVLPRIVFGRLAGTIGNIRALLAPPPESIYLKWRWQLYQTSVEIHALYALQTAHMAHTGFIHAACDMNGEIVPGAIPHTDGARASGCGFETHRAPLDK